MSDHGLTALPPGPEANLPVWKVELPDEAATLALARFIADELRPGDLVTLSGGLGAGKTTLARAVIRALTGEPTLEVPSPTFTLLQTYDGLRSPVVHADFYRINGADELAELGWDEATDGAVTLVEWPERAEGALSSSRLEIALEVVPAPGGTARVAVLAGTGAFGDRLIRAKALNALLHRTGWEQATRTLMQGDASSRAYERLTQPDGTTAILMVSPRRPDGPPVRNGLPYSAIARLAESVHAFVAMDRGLRALGFSAPKIYGVDLDIGLMILEDLGNLPVVEAGAPIPERYAEAVLLLARMHSTMLPNVLPVAEGVEHILPPYDLDALMIEVELLLDWYMPHIASIDVTVPIRSEFVAAWTQVLEEIVTGPTTWTLRDFHSPNLIWLPDREELERVGLIDFQDAVLGSPAYDVVSLLQDARVGVAPDLEMRLLAHYVRERKAFDAEFSTQAFARAYAILGAQRATKILGIFARLDRRDRKPQYLAHLPRIEAYLARNLAHPALTPVRAWYETHLPRLLGGA